MRVCKLCGIEDRPQLSGENCECGQSGDVLGHTAECKAIHHFVAPDWIILVNELEFTQRKLAAKGYQFVQKHGRQIAERLICRNCIRKQTELRLQRADYEEQAKKAEMGGKKTLYQVLCS